MSASIVRLLKIVWLISCVTVVAWEFVVCEHEPNSTLRGECSLLVAIIMALLTLPSGIVWWLVVSATGYGLSLIDIEVSASATSNLVVWLGFVVVGYLQWFVLLPWLWRKSKVRKAERKSTGNVKVPGT